MLGQLYSHLRTLTIKPAALDRLCIQAALVHKNNFKYTSFDIDRGEPLELPEETDPRFAKGSFLHHGTRPRFRDRNKYISPLKRANKMYELLQQEAIDRAIAQTPKVWEERFHVGDAIELEIVHQGGANTTNKADKELVRGVVLGIFRKRIDYSVLIRDVVQGHEIERKIPLHSPLVRSLKVLEENFVFKGKKRVKRGKLYYLSDRNPSICQVTGSKYKRKRED
ncbi:hypothetical protein ACA910_016886 [Epithemia clementina (nom. ined.)]